MTLAAAFKKVYGERLAAHGFKKIKSKYPYYVRLVNEEILHVITFKNETNFDIYSSSFVVWGGVATVYRKELGLDETILYNKKWLSNMPYLFKKEGRKIVWVYDYETESDESLIGAMQKSYEDMMEVLFPTLEEINTLDKCIDFLFEVVPTSLFLRVGDSYLYKPDALGCDESLMPIVAYGESGYEKYKEVRLKRIEIFKERKESLAYEEELSAMEKVAERSIEAYKTYTTDPVWKEKVATEIASRKEKNREDLIRWGLL